MRLKASGYTAHVSLGNSCYSYTLMTKQNNWLTNRCIIFELLAWSDSQLVLFYVQCMTQWLTFFIDVVRMQLNSSGYTTHVYMAKSSASSQLKSVSVTNVRWMRWHARGKLIVQKSWTVTENAAAPSVKTFSTIHLTINCVTNIKTGPLSESLLTASMVSKMYF